jgi:outer membrane protein assembly factor BamB
MDFQLLPSGRVLIAEYHARRVTERDTSGKIVWEVTNLPGAPINVQRLANGNTFIALYNNANVGGSVMEVDREGRTVASSRVGKGPPGPNNPFAPGEGLLIAAHRGAGGELVCLFAASTSCVRLDAGGKEIKRFPVGGINSSGVVTREGNIDVTPKGHLLVMQNLKTLTEFDAGGKVVWQVNVAGHRATRLANGNTLVASETAGVVELDAAGKTVWEYRPAAGYRAIRARQAGSVPLNIQAGGK